MQLSPYSVPHCRDMLTAEIQAKHMLVKCLHFGVLVFFFQICAIIQDHTTSTFYPCA